MRGKKREGDQFLPRSRLTIGGRNASEQILSSFRCSCSVCLPDSNTWQVAVAVGDNPRVPAFRCGVGEEREGNNNNYCSLFFFLFPGGRLRGRLSTEHNNQLRRRNAAAMMQVTFKRNKARLLALIKRKSKKQQCLSSNPNHAPAARLLHA